MLSLTKVVLLLITMVGSTISSELLLSGPQPMTTSFGSSAVFQCIAHRDVVVIQWYLNETSSSSYVDDGVMVKSILSGKDNYTSQLIVDTSYDYNSTMIKCVVVTWLSNGTQVSIASKSVLLIIQGVLAAPHGIYATALFCNFVTIHWVNPSSYSEIPISAVVISLLNTKPSPVSVNKTSGFKPSEQEDSYNMYLDECQNPCTPITVSVSVLNDAGLGEAGFGTFYFPEAPVLSDPHHVIHYSSSNILELQVYVKIPTENESSCVGRTPTAGEVVVSCNTQPGNHQPYSFFNTFPFTPVKSEDTYTHTATDLPQHMFCSYTVSLSSNENYENISEPVSFSTHPVQAVDISYQMGAREVTVICTFLQESLASGCLVVVQCAENFEQEVTIYRGISVVAVSDIITGIPGGACDVLAYDIDQAGTVGNYIAANNSFEVVIMNITPQAPSFSTDVQSTTSSSSEKVVVVIVVVTLLIVFIVVVLVFITILSIVLIAYKRKKSTPSSGILLSRDEMQEETTAFLPDTAKKPSQEARKEEHCLDPPTPTKAGDEHENKEEQQEKTREIESSSTFPPVSGTRQRPRAVSVSLGSISRQRLIPQIMVRCSSLEEKLGSTKDELLLPIDETKDIINALPGIPYELMEREIGHPLCEKWMELALALDFKQIEVNHIILTYGRNNLDCICEGVIKTWLNRGPRWETMLKALEGIGEQRRAANLRVKYVEGISQYAPSRNLIKKVSSELKEKWRLVAVFLNVPKHLVEMWKEDESKDASECIRLVFEWWKNSQSRYQLATLLDILEHPTIDHQDLAKAIRFKCSQGPRPSLVSLEELQPQSPTKNKAPSQLSVFTRCQSIPEHT